MKCKELMIYDWIEDRNGFPMKISLIGETHSRAAVIDDAGVIASYWDFDDNSNEPYPVKLSGEILEKNGWVFNEEKMNYLHSISHQVGKYTIPESIQVMKITLLLSSKNPIQEEHHPTAE